MSRLSIFDLVDKLHAHRSDDDLRYLARKFPVADFWAHSRYQLLNIYFILKHFINEERIG